MLYVVIPVHNRRNITCRCLARLQQVLTPEIVVVVVDDGSTDGTSESIREQFPWVRLLQGDGNLWWSGAVNAGIRYALKNSASAVMTMNDDTLVSDAFFPAMLEHHCRDPLAVIGALEVVAENGDICNGGERINWWTGERVKVCEKVPRAELTGLVPVTHLNGRGLLIPVEVIQKIGLFDEKNLPQRGADDDFTHRAIRAGFGVYCNYDAPLLVFPAMNGGHSLRQQYRWTSYWRHLFSLRGDGNLKVFTIYGLKNCPILCLPSFLMFGYVRRVLGYWLHRPKSDAC